MFEKWELVDLDTEPCFRVEHDDFIGRVVPQVAHNGKFYWNTMRQRKDGAWVYLDNGYSDTFYNALLDVIKNIKKYIVPTSKVEGLEWYVHSNGFMAKYKGGSAFIEPVSEINASHDYYIEFNDSTVKGAASDANKAASMAEKVLYMLVND